jgi:hypothetical protein
VFRGGRTGFGLDWVCHGWDCDKTQVRDRMSQNLPYRVNSVACMEVGFIRWYVEGRKGLAEGWMLVEI